MGKGLPKQPLFVPVGGLETEIDDKLLPLGKLLDLENAYMPRAGEAVKRFGTSALPAPGGVPFTLATHKGALVALPYADPLEVLATPTTAAWSKGTASSGPIQGGLASKFSTVALTKIAATSNTLAGTVNLGSDVCTNGTYYYTAYLDGGNARMLHFTALDVTTGHLAADFQQVLVGVDVTAFKVAFCNGQAVCAFATSAGAVNFLAMDSAFAVNTTNLGVVSLVGGGYGGNSFDLRVKDGTTVALVYPFDNAGSTVARCTDFQPVGAVVTNWSPKDSAGADIVCSNAAAWMQDFGASGKIALMASRAPTPDVRVHWDIPTAGATRQAASTYSFVPATDATRLTGHTTGSSATGQFVVVCGNSTTVPGNTNDSVGILSRLGGVLTTGPVLYRGASLRSRSWTYQGDFFAIVSFSSDTQGTHYVVKIPTVTTLPATAAPLAIFAVRFGKGGGLSGIATPSAGVFAVAIPSVLRFQGGMNQDALGVQLAVVRAQFLPDTTVGQPKEVIDSLFVPGAMLRHFDGVTYSEAGFAYGPEQPTLTPGAAGAGLNDNADYYYALVYSRVDAQMRLWRSPPSVIKLVHTGAGQRQVTVACPTLRLTGMSNVKIEVYRGTQGVIDLLLKVGVVSNSLIADTVNFVDTVTDAAQAAGEPLYTSGGVNDNQTPPGFISITIAQNRLWGISADDPQAIWYTNEFIVGHGLEWNETQIVDARDERGSMRGLAVIDNKPVGWKDDALYVGLGTGPNVLGQGGTYVFEVSTRGFGSANAMALCETKDGAMFVSTSQRAGIFLLDRSLSAQYIGAAVQRYIGETVTAGIYVSKLNQARFYTQSGRTLVYDVVNQQWSTFTGQGCLAAVSWNGVPVYVNLSANHVLYEKLDGTLYTEDGTAYTSVYGFPWLQVNQIKGYERFFRIQPVGERAGALTGLGATMLLYANFDESSALTGANFTDTAGSINQVLRYSAALAALKLVIRDASPTAGLKVNGYTAIVAAKTGLRPVATRMV